MEWIRGQRGGGYWHLLGVIEHWTLTWKDGRTEDGTTLQSACGAGGHLADNVLRTSDVAPGYGAQCPKCLVIAYLMEHGKPLERNV